jgi:Protein of unknown function (DUF3017)
MKHSAKGVAKRAREQGKAAGSHAARTGRAAKAAAPPPVIAPPVITAPVITAPGMNAPAMTATSLIAGGPDATAVPAASADRVASTQRATASRSAGHRLAQLPYAVVVAGMLLGLVLIRGGGQAVRGGTLVVAGALLAGSLTRLVLPDSSAGLLRSRRRLVDVAVLAALGVGLLVAGLIIQVPG